jgi:signal peptidase I
VALSAAAFLGLVVVARRRLLVIDVVGDSMAPTYRGGDRLLVRRTRRFRRGDVVIAHHQEGGPRTGPSPSYLTTWLVKRLVALPGDPVPECVVPVVGTADRHVPAGMTVLLGDHPDSADSRSWGFIPLADIAGVAVPRVLGR